MTWGGGESSSAYLSAPSRSPKIGSTDAQREPNDLWDTSPPTEGSPAAWPSTTDSTTTGRRGVPRRSGSVRVHLAARQSLATRLANTPLSSQYADSVSAASATTQSDLTVDDTVEEKGSVSYDIYGAPSEEGGYSMADYVGGTTIDSRTVRPTTNNWQSNVSLDTKGVGEEPMEVVLPNRRVGRSNRSRGRAYSRKDSSTTSRTVTPLVEADQQGTILAVPSHPPSILQPPQKFPGGRRALGVRTPHDDATPQPKDVHDDGTSQAETEDSWAMVDESEFSNRSRGRTSLATRSVQPQGYTLENDYDDDDDEDTEVEFYAAEDEAELPAAYRRSPDPTSATMTIEQRTDHLQDSDSHPDEPDEYAPSETYDEYLVDDDDDDHVRRHGTVSPRRGRRQGRLRSRSMAEETTNPVIRADRMDKSRRGANYR